MKLFALCIGATIAASLVAAQPVAEPLIEEVEIYPCDGDWAKGSKCSENAHCTIGDQGVGNNYYLGDLDILSEGICCGVPTNENPDLTNGCQLVTCGNGDCGYCFFEIIQPTPQPTGCCENNCCRQGKTIDGGLFDRNGPFDDTPEGANLFIQFWLAYVSSDHDVFISKEVEYCPHSNGQDVQTMEISLTDKYFQSEIYECIDLCCQCCRNLDIAITDPQTDGSVSDQCGSVVTQYATGESTRNYPGPAQICSNENHTLIYVHGSGVVAVDGGSSIASHRVAISCPNKQGGGNAGYQNLTDVGARY